MKKKSISIVIILICIVTITAYYFKDKGSYIPIKLEQDSDVLVKKQLIIDSLRRCNKNWNANTDNFMIIRKDKFKVTPIINCNSEVKIAKDSIYGISLKGDKLYNILPLKAIPIKILSLEKTDVKDISMLSTMTLSHLFLTDNSSLVNFAPLSKTTIRDLRLQGTNIKNVSLPKTIQNLTLSNTRINNLNFLEKTSLENLVLMNNSQLKDYSFMKKMKKLKEFAIYSQKTFSNLEYLSSKQYNNIVISKCEVSDLAPLKGKSIKKLHFSDSPITNISPLKSVKGLEVLALRKIKINNISCLKGKEIHTLRILDSPITNITSLKGMPLKHLALDNTLIKDISSLKGAPLQFLSLRNTKVEDLSPIKLISFQYLDITGTPAAKKPLPKGLKVKTLIK